MSKLPLASVICEATKLPLGVEDVDFPVVEARLARIDGAVAVEVVVDLAGDAAGLERRGVHRTGSTRQRCPDR